jgi:hypothetical protein
VLHGIVTMNIDCASYIGMNATLCDWDEGQRL